MATAFVDTAVLMYAGGTPHALREPSRRVLDLVGSGELHAVTSAEVVQEILYRYLAAGRPHVATRMARVVLDLFAPVLPVTHTVCDRAVELAPMRPDLSARDLLHAATCVVEGISVIISPDTGFDDVVELDRVDPGDEDGVRALIA